MTIKKLISIVIPIYNEAENILTLFNDIIRAIDKEKYIYEIIFVNDGSFDETLIILSKIKNSSMKIFNNKKNFGQSYSIFTGIQNAKNDTIITLDGDGQNDPEDIQRLLDIYFSYSDKVLVGGVRVKRKDSYIKILSSKVANFIRSKILEDNCSDSGCGLKVFSRHQFLKLNYFRNMHRFLPALFASIENKNIFIEVNHKERSYGNSKYGTFKRLVEGIFDIIKVKKIILNNKKLK